MSDKNIVRLDRLRNLIDSETARQVIADRLDCDVSLITKHYNGDRNVSLDFVVKYANYFNVSTDYLLGLTESYAPLVTDDNKALRICCDYTGLSKEAVEALKYEQNTVKTYNKINGENAKSASMMFYNQLCENFRVFKLEFDELFNDIMKSQKTFEEAISETKSLLNKSDEVHIHFETAVKQLQENKNICGQLFVLQENFIYLVKKCCNYDDYENLRAEYFALVDEFNHSTDQRG